MYRKGERKLNGKKFFISLFLLFLFPGCTSHYLVSPSQKINLAHSIALSVKKPPSLGKLDIAKVLRLGLKGNLDYQMIHTRVTQAGALVKQADSAFFPKINIGVRYIHADSPLTYFSTTLDQHKFKFGGNFNQTSDFGSGRGFVTIGYGLNLGGSQVFQSLMAKLERAIARKEREKILNTLITSLIEAYYNALAAKKAIHIAEEAVKTLKSQLSETKVRFKGGSALKSDVLALEVRLAAAKENLIKSRNRYELLKNALAILMGLNPNYKLDLEEKPWEPFKLPKSYEKGIRIALQNRAEIKIMENRYLQARYNQRLAQSRYFPNLQFFGNYYFEDRDFKYTLKRDNWILGVELSMPLFDGLYTYGKIKEAIAKKKEARLGYKKTLLGIQHEVKAAYLNLNEAENRVKVLKLAVKQGEENFRLVKKQFEGGAATITKYLDAEFALNSTKFQLLQAQYDLKKAKAKLGHALGLCQRCIQKI
ncbi:MAG: TolC family protein [Planctomycetota bacterium]|nr:MAG: TolC family protein [Planctomycetota bacterium]